MAADAAHDMITASSHPDPRGDVINNADGIPYSHAYTVLGVNELSTGQRLVRLRNPWGRDSFTGEWSDKSPLWTDALRAEVGVGSDDQDGIIFMSLEDFAGVNFSQTSVNLNTEGMHHSYFLVIDDQSKVPGKYSWCGSKCSRHVFKIFSPVTQTLHISVNVWPERSYPLECQEAIASDNGNHLARLGKSRTLQGFTKGETIFEPLEAIGGQSITLELEFDWTREDISKDFSVVVWGAEQEVEIEHQKLNRQDPELVTDHFPNLSTGHAIPPSDEEESPVPEEGQKEEDEEVPNGDEGDRDAVEEFLKWIDALTGGDEEEEKEEEPEPQPAPAPEKDEPNPVPEKKEVEPAEPIRIPHQLPGP